MKIWFISDTHLGHERIIPFTQRPFPNAQVMNDFIIQEWNARVAPEDLVYHLGDFASPRCKDPKPYLDRLNGKIILVRGNHDSKKLIRRFPTMIRPFCSLRIGPYNCLLQHYPYYPKWMRNSRFDRFNDHYSYDPHGMDRYDFVLSGHIHNNYEIDMHGHHIGRLFTGISLNLGVEMTDYRPLSEDEVLELLSQRHFEISHDPGAIDNIVPGDSHNQRIIKKIKDFTSQQEA